MDGLVGSVTACYGSSLGSNPDFSNKYKMGHTSSLRCNGLFLYLCSTLIQESIPSTHEKKNKRYGREQAIWSVFSALGGRGGEGETIETFPPTTKKLGLLSLFLFHPACTICTSLQMYRERGRNSFTGGLWIAIRYTAHDTEDNAH